MRCGGFASIVLIALATERIALADPDTVALKSGGTAQGKIVEFVPGKHVDIELSPGKAMSFRWDEIDGVSRGLTGDAALGVVEMHDGRVHGTITEIVIDDHVTVELPNGTNRTIPWVDIVRMKSGEHVQLAPPPPTVSPRTSEPTAVVIIDSSEPVHLYRMSRYGDVDDVCVSPCQEEIPRRGEFRVSGTETNASNHFELGVRSEVKVVVRGGNKSASTAGKVMAGIGAGLLVPTAFLWLLTAVAAGAPVQTPGDKTTGTFLSATVE